MYVHRSKLIRHVLFTIVALRNLNLSFCFFRYENRQGLEANFVHLFKGNSQAAIFENNT